jgi:hypothetical protein
MSVELARMLLVLFSSVRRCAGYTSLKVACRYVEVDVVVCGSCGREGNRVSVCVCECTKRN